VKRIEGACQIEGSIGKPNVYSFPRRDADPLPDARAVPTHHWLEPFLEINPMGVALTADAGAGDDPPDVERVDSGVASSAIELFAERGRPFA
jgi:hypothetical protein